MGSPYEDLAQGSQAEALAALRTLQAAWLTTGEPDPSLSREFRATLDALASVADSEASASDDLAAARKARLSAAKSSVAS